MPAIARQEIRNVMRVIGMCLRRPPIVMMSPGVVEPPCSMRVHDRAGAEEQTRLEERVRDEVEDRGGPVAGAGGDEHEAELD